MIEALANRDPEQYGETSDEQDKAMLAFLVDVVLLQRPNESPSSDSSNGTRALIQWSQVGRAGLGEHPKDG